MLIYYCQNNYLFAIKTIYEKYFRLVQKICWNYYKKYPLLYSDFNITLIDGRFVFFQSINKYCGEKKVSFKYFLCLHLKYHFIHKVRINLNSKNKALTTAYLYEKNEKYDKFMKCKKINIAKKAQTKIFYDQIMDDLKKEDQEIIRLWTEGYSYKEISYIKNVSTKRIDNLLQRIIRVQRKQKPYLIKNWISN